MDDLLIACRLLALSGQSGSANVRFQMQRTSLRITKCPLLRSGHRLIFNPICTPFQRAARSRILGFVTTRVSGRGDLHERCDCRPFISTTASHLDDIILAKLKVLGHLDDLRPEDLYPHDRIIMADSQRQMNWRGRTNWRWIASSRFLRRSGRYRALPCSQIRSQCHWY
jgi:hypothetical protein